MTKRFSLSDVLRMVAETKRLIADGMTAEDAAIKAGFTGYQQYYQQAKRLGAMEDLGEKPFGWEKKYTPQPLPDAPEPTDIAEPKPMQPEPAAVEFDLRPDPYAAYRILIDQMQIVQALSRTCIVPADMAILSDALIRLSDQISN